MIKLLRITACLFGAVAVCFGTDIQLSEAGRKAEEASCIACHSTRLIDSQRLSAAAWTKEVDKMIGWGAIVPDRRLLIDYLSSEYNISKPVPPPAISGNGVEKSGMSKRIALVTGGSRGIGRAIVEELSKTHEVIATYNTNREAAQAVADSTGAAILACDLGDISSIYRLVEDIRQRFAPVELLVNNAGIAPRERRDILEATPDSFDEIVRTNLKGPYFLTQQIARRMIEHERGRIVFIGSISSFTASVNRGDYCMAKAGLSMAVKLFAARLAEHNIPVFDIQPGIIRTDMIASVAAAYEKRIADGLLPQRRMGEPEDIARTVRAIADGQLDYCTGQVIHADGGFHLRIL